MTNKKAPKLLAFFIVILGLCVIITCTVLYRRFVFHNLFFQNLDEDLVKSVWVYDHFGRGLSELSPEDTERALALIRQIRIHREPYKNYELMGDSGWDLQVRLRCGIVFNLNLGGGDPGVYIIDDNAYSVGHRTDLSAQADFENIWALEELCSRLREAYYPQNAFSDP